MIDAHEERDAMTSNTSNTFAQASLKREKGKARLIMKITGVSVEPLVKKAPHTFAALEHGQKAMCFNVLKAMCGMLESALPWHQKFQSDPES